MIAEVYLSPEARISAIKTNKRKQRGYLIGSSLPKPQLATFQHTETQTICRTRRTSLQHRQTIRMWSSIYMERTYQRRSDMEPIEFSAEGQHEKHGWGEHSRREVSVDKRWRALISLTVPSPACPAQSDTHGWCWSAGAYPIMDVDTRSVEMYRAFDQERSWERALNGSWTQIFDGAIRPILIG